MSRCALHVRVGEATRSRVAVLRVRWHRLVHGRLLRGCRLTNSYLLTRSRVELGSAQSALRVERTLEAVVLPCRTLARVVARRSLHLWLVLGTQVVHGLGALRAQVALVDVVRLLLWRRHVLWLLSRVASRLWVALVVV